MKTMAWLQERIGEHWRVLTPLLAVAGSLLLYFGTQNRVTLILNGQPQSLTTHARTVESLLASLDIELQPGDQVVPASETALTSRQVVIFNASRPVVIDTEGRLIEFQTTEALEENVLNQAGIPIFPGDQLVDFAGEKALAGSGPQWIRLERAQRVILKVDGVISNLYSTAPTLGQALWEAGYPLFAGDRLDPDPSTPLDGPISASLVRSRNFLITADGRTVSQRGSGKNVGEILTQAGIGLAGLDYTIPDVQAAVPANGRIQVVRVSEEILVELEPVEFETAYQPADHLELDTLEVLETGSFGVRSNTVRIRFEDGQEVGRSVEDAVIAVEPKDRVIGYGTQIVVRTLDTGQGVIEYWRAIPIYATSYSPCNLGVPWCGSRTASGKEVVRGVIGVIRSWYNLMRGWSVYVPGYGPGTFEDIGAGIAGRDWIDLGFTDENFEPWHQWTTLYFLTPVPSADAIPWILP